jgi:hypothetical protein
MNRKTIDIRIVKLDHKLQICGYVVGDIIRDCSRDDGGIIIRNKRRGENTYNECIHPDFKTYEVIGSEEEVSCL